MFVLLMAPFSQEMEPPQLPGRFSIIESAPLMLGSAGAVRAVAANLLARAGIAPGTAAAQQFLSRPDIVAKLGTIGSVAEGATAAGSIQEEARQEGRSYSESAPYALAGGVGTAVIGKAASKLLPDADVAAGTVGLGAGRTSVGQAATAIGKGVVQEGIVEELPQSAQEQVMTNLATGKPWDESVGKAAAQGMVAGMGMGAGANAANQLARINPALDAELTQREQDAAATGDPLEVSVVRLENDVLRNSEIRAHSERLLAAGIEGAPSIIDTIDPATRLEVARALMASLNPETTPAQPEVMGTQETASTPSPFVEQPLVQPGVLQPAQVPSVPVEATPTAPVATETAPDVSLMSAEPAQAAEAVSADVQPVAAEAMVEAPAPMLMSNGQPFPSQKLAAESARQRKLQMTPIEVGGGWGLVPTEMPQAQALQPDIPTAPVTPEAAPVQAPQADIQQDAPVTRSASPVTLDAPITAPELPAPMLMSNGKPFASAKLAAESARQRKLDMVPVEVSGGWGLATARAQAANTQGTLPVPPTTPNAAPAVAPVTTRATRDTLRTVAAARMPSLGKTVDRLIVRGEAGKRGGLVVVETEADLPSAAGGRVGPVTSRGPDGRIRGLYDPNSGLHYIVSENVDATEALAVLLHEATHGQQRAAIDAKAARMLENRSYYPAPVRTVLDRVAQRMEAAGETGSASETTAYMVEEAVMAGRQAGFSAVDSKFMTWVDNRLSKRVGELVRDFVAMVRAWGIRRGVPFNPTLDDLVALAQYGLKQAERGNVTFGEENRRLREEHRTLWVKAKSLLRRQLAPGGLLPENVFHEKVARDNQLNALEFDIRHVVGGLEQAVWKDFGKRIEKLSETEPAQLTEALAGRVPTSLPEATTLAILAMRQYIDGLSSEYVQILDEQITAKLNQGEEVDTGLRDRILSNVGQYVNRSYRAFDDPQWFKKVPDSVLSNARDFLRNGYLEAGETEAEAARLTEVTLHEILKNGTAYDSMESFIAEGKLGAKDLSVLMPRKNVPDELRALLGEHTDPRLTFAKSASKMGRLIWNQRFLDRVREVGMGAFLFEGMNRPPEATTQIAAEGSETYSPLNGLWTFPEVAQAFKDALGKEQMADWYRVIVRLNGMVKYGKTVLSPTTAMRNWQSAMFFSLANGHFNLLQMRKSVAAFREQVAQNATGDNLAYLRHLKTLGVVYDSPYAGEMKRLLDDSQIEELLNTSKGTVLRGFRKANSVAQGFYSFGDDFWKIIGFENEKASLVKAGFTPQEAEVEAAKRIRNTYPTYSLVGRAIRSLGRFPLAGTFVSFPAEIIRTTGNMLALVASDLRSDNPGLRRLGVRRALGMAMVSGGFYALSAISKAGAGVDDDEEEALRDLAPPWQKNSTFLYTGRDEDGKLRYFDMSFLDPYGYLKRPLTAMMRDQPWEKIAASSVSDLLSPFLGADISAEAVYRVFSNTTSTGGKVYQEGPGVSPVDQTLAIADYLRKALQPGFMGNIERITKAAQGQYREGSGQKFSLEDEMVALLGWRASTVDPKTALRYRSYEFGDRLSDARGAVNRVLRSQNEVTDDDITKALERGQAMHRQSFEEMRRIVAAARNSGMTEKDVREVLEAGSLSKQNIDALIRGEVPPFTVSEQAAKGAARQAELTRDKAHADDIKRRFETARDRTQ
ncbi:MAG: DNA polymerase III subunit gamma/tau domain-containing protein [Thauera sp.]